MGFSCFGVCAEAAQEARLLHTHTHTHARASLLVWIDWRSRAHTPCTHAPTAHYTTHTHTHTRSTQHTRESIARRSRTASSPPSSSSSSSSSPPSIIIITASPVVRMNISRAQGGAAAAFAFAIAGLLLPKLPPPLGPLLSSLCFSLVGFFSMHLWQDARNNKQRGLGGFLLLLPVNLLISNFLRGDKKNPRKATTFVSLFPLLAAAPFTQKITHTHPHTLDATALSLSYLASLSFHGIECWLLAK